MAIPNKHAILVFILAFVSSSSIVSITTRSSKTNQFLILTIIMSFHTTTKAFLIQKFHHHYRKYNYVKPRISDQRKRSVIHKRCHSSTPPYRNLLKGKVKDDENYVHATSMENVNYDLPSIKMPQHSISNVIRSKILQPYYPKCFQGVFPRPKVVRDIPENLSTIEEEDTLSTKVIIIDPVFYDSQYGKVEEVTSLNNAFPGLPSSVIHELEHHNEATVGPRIEVSFPKAWLPLDRLLRDALPESVHPPPSGFEEIGHVLHLNLKEHHLPYKYEVGKIILEKFGEKNNGKIRTVVNKIGEVGGMFRTYDFEVIASSSNSIDNQNGDDDQFFVTLLEDGISMQFDIRKVYWCSRLGGERKRLIEAEFKKDQIIADAFCGAGALIVNAAKTLNCTILANDLNPDAVKYALANAENNGIPQDKFQVQCGDARDFIRHLGINTSSNKSCTSLPNHVILNFPLDSCSFLDQLRWWPSESANSRETKTSIHVYTFARADNDRSSIEVAIDMVADNLLPEGGYSKQTFFRRKQLDELGCNIRAHEVRDVAPGKVVICVSFDVTTMLLKHMQGEFLDMSTLSQTNDNVVVSYRRLNDKYARMKRGGLKSSSERHK